MSTDLSAERARRDRFVAFRYPNYRKFWFGQIISVTGTWMQSLAQSWLVVDTLQASGFELGLVNVLQFGPVLLLGIPAGVVVDRVPKRNLLLGTQTVFGLLAVVLAILTATDRIELWHIFVLSTLFGITNSLDMPTRQAFVSELVEREALPNAIALNAALFNTARVLGPGVAGAVLALFGAAICFGINAVSYLAVLFSLYSMSQLPGVIARSGSALVRLQEGLQYVRHTSAILRTVVLVGLLATFGMNFNVWLPLLAKEDFGAGAATFGLLFASMGFGSLTGALSLAFSGFSPSSSRMIITGIGFASAELVLAAVASIPLPVVVGMISLVFVGFFSSVTMASGNTLVQTTAEDFIRGRVMAVYMTVFAGSVPFGAIISGTLADRFSAVVSVTVCASIAILVALVLGWLQRSPAPVSKPSAVLSE